MRNNNPAPNSSSTAVATSPTTSSERSFPPPPVTVRVSEVVTAADENSVACHAGTMPKITPVRIVATTLKIAMRASNASVTALGSSPSGITTGATRRIAAPTATPRAPPMAERVRLSVTSCRITRWRLPPKRRSNRELAGSGRRARQQQAGDVGAADQQHEADDSEKQERRRPKLAAHQGIVHRLDGDPSSLVGVGKLTRQSFGDCRHLGAGGVDGDVRLQASDAAEQIGASQLRAPIERQQSP